MSNGETEAYKRGYERGRSGKPDADSIKDVVEDSLPFVGRTDAEREQQEQGYRDGYRDQQNERQTK